jgi:hypothetical protein
MMDILDGLLTSIENVVSISTTSIPSTTSTSVDLNDDIKEKLLNGLLGRYKKDAKVSLKKGVPVCFFHGLPAHLTQLNAYLHLKREDKSEFCIYDPWMEKWIVITAIEPNTCYGSPTRDLPLSEWPKMSHKDESLITLERACQKSFNVNQQIQINGFGSIDKAPVYLLLSWLYDAVPLELSEKIHHTVLIDIAHEHIDVFKFITPELRAAVAKFTSEYARIFPEDLINLILENETKPSSPFQRSIIDDSEWIHYIISFNQLNLWNVQHCVPEKFLVPPPPKIRARKIQEQLKQYYETSIPTEASIGASVEAFQNPDTVLKTDESGYRIGTLTSSEIIIFVEDLNKRLENERRLRLSQNTDFTSLVQQTELMLRGEFQNADTSLQDRLETKVAFDRRFRDIATRSRFEMHLEGVTIPDVQERRSLVNMIRKYRLVMDNVFTMFISLQIPYTDFYLLNPNILEQGSMADTIPFENPLGTKFTFHDLVGRRFLIWSDVSKFFLANAQINFLKEQEDSALEIEFIRLQAYFPNGYDIQLESITSQWPHDILPKLVDPQKSPNIAGKKGTLGPALQRLRSLVISRLGVTDFKFFRRWIERLLLRKYNNHTLPLYGIYIDEPAFKERISRIESSMNAILGNDVSAYATAYEFLTDHQQFEENAKFLLTNTVGSLKYMSPLESDRLDNPNDAIDIDAIADYKALATVIQFYARDKSYQSQMEGWLSRRISTVFLRDFRYQRELFSQITASLESGDETRKPLARMITVPIFQSAFRALKTLIDSVDVTKKRTLREAFSFINVARLPVKEDNSPYAVQARIDEASKGLTVTESREYAYRSFEDLVSYFLKETTDSIFSFFKLHDLEGATTRDFSLIPNHYELMTRALMSLHNDLSFLHLKDAGSFDLSLTKNISLGSSPIAGAPLSVLIEDVWKVTTLGEPRTIDDDSFYALSEPNHTRYALLIMRFLCLFDIHLHGNFLERDYDVRSEVNNYFVLHLYLFNILTDVSSLKSTHTWEEWIKVQNSGDLILDFDLLYGDLTPSDQKRGILIRFFEELFLRYLMYLGSDDPVAWPYSQVDTQATVDMWIEQRQSITGIDARGMIAPGMENINALWNNIVTQTPSMREDVALFFIPFLSLLIIFKNPWYRIKYNLWLLDPHVVARMYNAGMILPRLGKGIKPLEKIDYFIVEKGRKDVGGLLDDRIISSPILDALFHLIDGNQELSGEKPIPITNSSILRLIDFVSKFSETTVDNDTKDRIFERLYDLGYDTFPLYILDVLSLNSITGVINRLQSETTPPSPPVLQKIISEVFNIKDFEETDSESLLTYENDFRPLLVLLKEFEYRALKLFSLQRQNEREFRLVSQLVASLIYTPYIPLDVLFALRSEFTVQSSDHQQYLEDQLDRFSGLNYSQKFFRFIHEFYVSIIKDGASFKYFDTRNLLFNLFMTDLLGNVSMMRDINKRRGVALYTTMKMVYDNTNGDQDQLASLLNTLKDLHDSIASCSELSSLINSMEESESLYDYEARLGTPSQNFGVEKTWIVLRRHTQEISKREPSLRDREKEIEEFKHIHQFYTFYCQSISLLNLQKILMWWNVEFSLPPIDPSTLRYALLRDYYQRSLVDRIFSLALTSNDVFSAVGDDVFIPQRLLALEESDYILAAAIQRVKEVILETNNPDDLNVWKTTVNARISPIHYFFNNLGISDQLSETSPSTSALSTESVDFDTLFAACMKFIPDTVIEDDQFDIGDKMLISRIIQLVSEAFASRIGYVSDPIETVSNLLQIKDYLLRDPREEAPGVLGMKSRERDLESFSFPFISPFLNTPSLRYGSHIHLAQMIVHLTSPI